MTKDNHYTENYSTGWIKSYRSITQKGWYTKRDYAHLWHHLLYCANYRPSQIMFKGKNIYLTPGHVITGRKKLAAETGIEESKVERILKCFENEHQIEQATDGQKRIITIVSWDAYQKNEQANEQGANSNRTATEQRPNTVQEELKNGNNEKNVYKPNKCFTPPAHTEVVEYFQSISLNGDFESEAKIFISHYQSKGWMVGNSPMVNWQASADKWEPREKKKKTEPEQGLNFKRLPKKS